MTLALDGIWYVPHRLSLKLTDYSILIIGTKSLIVAFCIKSLMHEVGDWHFMDE